MARTMTQVEVGKVKKMKSPLQSNMPSYTRYNVGISPYDGRADKAWAREKKRKWKKSYFFLLLLILTGLIGSGASLFLYKDYSAKYHDDLALAATGIKSLQTGISLVQGLSKNPLDASTITSAQHEFVASYASFTQLNTDLQSLPGISTSIPVYGNRLSGALHLAPLAVEMSQAGIVGCNMLSLIANRLHEPLNAGQGITMADLTTISNDFHLLEAMLTQATLQVNALQPGDIQFDPRVGKAITDFHKYLPPLQTSLDAINQLLPVLPTLLGIGKPANYLVEVLDSTELRPGGGFIGNYGIVTLASGRLVSAHVTDTYLLDNTFNANGGSISFPPQYSWFHLVKSWGLRDSNLDADFPTDAQYAEQNYKIEGGNTPLQGVIALTPFLIQHALAITGPIAVPEYGQTVTAQNLIDLIHYYQLGPGRQGQDTPSPDGTSSVRKHFTALLAEHFLARIHQLPSTALSELARLLFSSLQTKDIQIYFNAPVAEHLLALSHVDSSIKAPANDSLFVVEANITGNKASQFITRTMQDRVTLDSQGNILHQTTLTYDWKTNGPTYGPGFYRAYVRVYVPPGSTLESEQGWLPGETGKVFGREFWSGYFSFSYSQIRTITFTWREVGAVQKVSGGWHYQYFLQRQAATNWNINVQVALPSCTVRMTPSGGLAARGKQEAAFAQPLSKDTDLSVAYSC